FGVGVGEGAPPGVGVYVSAGRPTASELAKTGSGSSFGDSLRQLNEPSGLSATMAPSAELVMMRFPFDTGDGASATSASPPSSYFHLKSPSVVIAYSSPSSVVKKRELPVPSAGDEVTGPIGGSAG